ncbi:hypothetical protein WG855_003738 [Escherichia coli]|nr:hypothetical protein [Escherichia coli]HDQ6808640.1 hypothetical protein [Escherichia coli O22:H16]HDQ6829339.1 hypothetical protein [Escherichia coli O128:H2]EFG2981131.1 hypothetical protein [Escherichia coli]EFG6327275.1 hypothetical protein [Escherichia coli]
MNTDILFDDASTSEYSRAFVVSPGCTAIISAWGFAQYIKAPEEGKPKNIPQLAIVQKMAFDKGIFPNGSACAADEGLISVPKYSYVEDVTQCGLWALSACNNTVALSVPGTYRLQLNDAAAVGTVFISLTRYSQQELGYIPYGMYLGVE